MDTGSFHIAKIIVTTQENDKVFRLGGLVFDFIEPRDLFPSGRPHGSCEDISISFFRDGHLFDHGYVREYGNRGLNYFVRGLSQACPMAPRWYSDIIRGNLLAHWFIPGDELQVHVPWDDVRKHILRHQSVVDMQCNDRQISV